jgi:peptidoglycan/xylan/chitin deacetylase (PgdA/CDA1 family)
MTGTVTQSVELELGWGMHDKAEYDHLSQSRAAENRALHRLLDSADQYGIPITFDIVGHLLEDSCSGEHAGPYPDDWWTEDPGTDIETDPLFYAPDLVQEIKDRSVEHELTTHTYSHLLADEASSEELARELSKVDDIHARFGLPSPTTIVMPRHQQPDYSVLTEFGIDVIRQPMSDYSPDFSNSLSKLWWLLTRDHPTSDLRMNDGIVETTVTPHPSLTSVTLPTGQSGCHPVFSAIPMRVRQSLHRRYLRKAINRAQNSHIHLWSHMFNMANNSQWTTIKSALSYLAKKKRSQDIVVKTIDGLSSEL